MDVEAGIVKLASLSQKKGSPSVRGRGQWELDAAWGDDLIIWTSVAFGLSLVFSSTEKISAESYGEDEEGSRKRLLDRRPELEVSNILSVSSVHTSRKLKEVRL